MNQSSEQNKRQKVGVVGYGQFGEFIVGHLVKYFDVTVFSTRDLEGALHFVNYTKPGLEKELQDLDYLILSVPFNAFEETCKIFSEFVNEKTIVVDVTSVKVKPIKLMKLYFLNNQILGTHPIFGPQSGKNGIEGLPIVLTNVSVEENKYLEIKKFLESVFKLNVIEKTADEHDREMAEVHGLSHFIGRTLFAMGIKDYDTATKGYKNLMNLA